MGNRRIGSTEIEVPEKVKELFKWVRKQSTKVKVLIGAAIAAVLLVALEVFVRNKGHFFLASYAVHAVGILLLIYKLTLNKSCAGLSLKTQELTAIFLALRILMHIYFRALDVHDMLHGLSLLATLWVIYMMRFKLRATYNKHLDNMPLHYVLLPCSLLAILTYPKAPTSFIIRIAAAFGMYVEAVSVLPQLRMMQNAKMVEPFTGHYVFALGVSRFLGCGHWIIRIVKSKGQYLLIIGRGNIWLLMLILCEAVQTFILADFCYYYAKSVMEGEFLMKLPSVG